MRVVSFLIFMVCCSWTLASEGWKTDPPAANKNKNNHLAEYDLRGPVKSSEEFQLEATELRPCLIFFNRAGNIKKKIVYREDSAYWATELYTYNEAGKIKECILVDENNNRMPEASLGIYRYDSKGYEVEQLWYDADSTLSKKIVINYYDNRWIQEYIEHLPQENNAFSRVVYEYEDSDQPVKESYYEGNEKGEKLKFFNIYLYNSAGQIQKEQYHDGLHGFESEDVYQFDQNENPIEIETFTKKGKLEQVLTFEYVYDKHQNWVKKDIFIDGELSQSVTRKIEYW